MQTPHPRPPALALLLLATICGEAFSAQAPPARVRVATVLEETIAPRRSVTAELRSPRIADVASVEPGIVSEVLVREGDSVVAGDVVARLTDVRLELDLAIARASLAAAEAEIGERGAEERQAIRDLALVEESRAALAANQRELLDAESRREVAAARLEAARRGGAVERARIALLEQRIRDLSIAAPFDGVVVDRFVEVGQWLPPGGAVARIVEIDRLEAWISVPQSVFDRTDRPASNGSTQEGPFDRGGVSLRIDATGEILDLDAVRIVPEVSRRGRTFTAIGTIANPGRRLLPGMSATAYVPLGEPRPWLLVPKDAMVFRDGGASVWTIRPGREGEPAAIPAPVEAAFPLGDRWAIRRGGVGAGEEVVVEGNERLMPMTPVAPIAANGDESSSP
jgi:membrane fusion protein (multidrug efflux system)